MGPDIIILFYFYCVPFPRHFLQFSKLKVDSSVLFYLFIPKYLLSSLHVQLTIGDLIVSKADLATLCPVCILAGRKDTIRQ